KPRGTEEQGRARRTDDRTIQLLMGHRSLSTTANYLRIATTKVRAATSPLDLLPRPVDAKAFLPPATERQGRWIVRSRRWQTCFAATAQPIVRSSARGYLRHNAASWPPLNRAAPPLSVVTSKCVIGAANSASGSTRVRTVTVPNASRWLAPAGLKTDNPSFWAPTYVLLADMWRSLM